MGGSEMLGPATALEQNFLPAAFSVSHFQQRIELLGDKGMENAPFVSPSDGSD